MQRIAVVGSINMDLVVTADRIPLAGETLAGQTVRHYPGGKGANQAVAAARLGGIVQMFGCVGEDANGEALLRNLTAAGVDISCVLRRSGVPTGMAFITAAQTDNTIVIIAGANACVTPAYLEAQQAALLQADIFLLQNEISQESNDYIIRLASKYGKTVILNPAPARLISAELLDLIGYLTPNEHEARLIFGAGAFGGERAGEDTGEVGNGTSDEPAVDASNGKLPERTRDQADLKKILRRFPEQVIVTQGAQGVRTALHNGDILHIPAYPAQVVDTTGAGDTFNGALACALAQGRVLPEALAYANAAASCATEHAGAQVGMPNHAEVLERLGQVEPDAAERIDHTLG